MGWRLENKKRLSAFPKIIPIKIVSHSGTLEFASQILHYTTLAGAISYYIKKVISQMRYDFFGRKLIVQELN